MGEWLAEHEGVWSERHYDARLSRSRTIANYFETTAAITEDSIRQFYLARLRKVTNGAVKLDRSALKMFCEWAAEAGYMPAISIPPLPKGIKGTSAIDRPHVRLTPEQARTIIEELPEHTKISRKPIRTMMEVAWDTGLRAYGLWRLESPRHCPRRGELYMSSDIDKEGFARTLRLRPETSDRLDALGDGLLFGKFTYLRTLRKAAHRVANVTGLTAYECDHVDLRDFRHAAATALWHQSNSLAAVAFMLGHTQETTTVRYLDLHENVYAEAIDKHFSVAKLVAVGDDVSRPVPNVLQSLPTPTGAPAPAPARM
jgi:site-specific recombinase XerC